MEEPGKDAASADNRGDVVQGTLSLLSSLLSVRVLFLLFLSFFPVLLFLLFLSVLFFLFFCTYSFSALDGILKVTDGLALVE